MSVTSNWTGMPRGTSPSRQTENAALKQLPRVEQQEYEAVKKAIATTERYRNGHERLSIIRMVLWKKTHTLEGAARMVPCSHKTARQWHGEFVRLVAKCYGLMD